MEKKVWTPPTISDLSVISTFGATQASNDHDGIWTEDHIWEYHQS